VWLVTAGVFAGLAHDCYKSSGTTLERFYRLFPKDTVILVGGMNYAQVMSDMADANNRNVNNLEDSIRRSAKFQIWLNIVSFLMALIGLTAQIATFMEESRKHHQHARHHQRS
jgi:hypothetical protein